VEQSSKEHSNCLSTGDAMSWLAILDMDGTILELRTVDVLCEKLKLKNELEAIDQTLKDSNGHEISLAIAKLFSGYEASKLEKIFDTIPLVDGIHRFLDFLRSRKFISCIVTDSYTFLAARLAHALGIDAVRGNQLEIVNGVITGKIEMPLGWEHLDLPHCNRKAICKLNTMIELANHYSISMDRVIAVGDSKSDSCMVRRAKIGIAFRPKDHIITGAADVIIRTDFYDLQRWLEHFLDRLTN
jgi:phosphoserine phosphatase